MVNKNKQSNKKGSTTAAPSAVNGTAYTNGCHQKNGIRESEDEQNSNTIFAKLSGVSTSASVSQEDSSSIRTAHEPTTSFSVESQTELAAVPPSSKKAPEDGLIIFSKLSLWSRVETICELAKILNPTEVRLLGACIEGSARPAAPQLKGPEFSANNSAFISRCLENSHWTYPAAVKETFNMLCLLNSTNRQCAFAYVKLIDRLMSDRHRNLGMLPEAVRLTTYELLGSLVTAAVHHPAFAVDQCMRLSCARDELLREYEKIRPAPSAASSLFQTHPYIKRIRASAPKEGDKFSLELHWNDGQVTWAVRTKENIAELHGRLLNIFGKERRDDPSNGSEAASPSPQQRAPHRILPYFKLEMSDADVVDYLNSLSDLPARMMLSSAIYDEFLLTRVKSPESTGGVSGFIARTSPVPPTMPITTPSTYIVASAPLSYRSNPDDRLQVSSPSCSNCAGEHLYVTCPERTIQEIQQSGKDGYRCFKPSDESESPHLGRHAASPPYALPLPPGLGGIYPQHNQAGFIDQTVLARLVHQQPFIHPHGGHH